MGAYGEEVFRVKLILIMSIIFILCCPSIAATNIGCTDSDDGQDFFSSGSTEMIFKNGKSITKDDKCLPGGKLKKI